MKTKASNKANQLQELSGNKVGDKQKIVQYLKDNYKISIFSCIYILEMKIQTASARLSDLQDEGILEYAGEGKYYSFYKLSANPEKAKAQREKIKINGLIKKLKGYGYEVIKKENIIIK